MRKHRSSLVLIVILSGCATTQYDVEWSNDDEARVWDADAYDCEEQAVKRGAIKLFTPDIQDSTQFVECMVRKYGWIRIRRQVVN